MILKLIKSLSHKKSPKTLDKPAKRDAKRYAGEKEKLASQNVKDRLTLARSDKTHQEILYYLAENDPDIKVRKAVATNSSTPLQAGEILAKDDHPDVRMALAKRLINLLPHLEENTHSQLYAYVVQALGSLALDEVIKIRIALSSALKDIAQTPPKIAHILARDIEREVSEPILRFCMALSDDDMIDILKTHPQSWAAQAIAARDQLSNDVSDAVIDTDDVAAGQILMDNQGANISIDLLRKIIQKSRDIPEWQGPIAHRNGLPFDLAKQLIAFANDAVMDILTKRKDFDPDMRADIAQAFERRLELANADEQAGDMPIPDKINALENDGRLTEEILLDYLGMRDTHMATAILARLAKITAQDVTRIMDMRAPKPVVALCAKAGLSMRAALQIEKSLAMIDPKELLYPRNGTQYPLTQDEIDWQLDFLGIG